MQVPAFGERLGHLQFRLLLGEPEDGASFIEQAPSVGVWLGTNTEPSCSFQDGGGVAMGYQPVRGGRRSSIHALATGEVAAAVAAP